MLDFLWKLKESENKSYEEVKQKFLGITRQNSIFKGRLSPISMLSNRTDLIDDSDFYVMQGKMLGTI